MRKILEEELINALKEWKDAYLLSSSTRTTLLDIARDRSYALLEKIEKDKNDERYYS